MSSNLEQVHRSLCSARFEVLPLRGVLGQVAQLPAGTTVTVTSSPAKGVDATLELTEQLAQREYHVVPHLAARLIRDRTHLSTILDRLAFQGVSEAFVIGGDSPQPAGEYPDALSLLRAIDELGRRPERIGITGYPERHAAIPDDVVVQTLNEKSQYADYIVSQICYSPETIAAWVKDVRARGVALPIYVGMPGAVDATKLLRISLKIGLGESMRFLRKQYGIVSKLLTRYTPQQIVDELTPYLADPGYGIAGWHLFTFNEVAKTVEWRQEVAEQSGEIPA